MVGNQSDLGDCPWEGRTLPTQKRERNRPHSRLPRHRGPALGRPTPITLDFENQRDFTS